MRRAALLWLLALAVSACVPTRPSPKQLGAESDAEACARDEAAACVSLGDVYREDAEKAGAGGHPTAVRRLEADAHYRKACALGEPAGCERLSGASDASLVRYGLDQLCRRHARAEACLRLAEAWGEGRAPARERDETRARELLELACTAGELDRGCARLATALGEGRGGEKDLPRAFALHERVCRMGQEAAASCVQAGRALLNGVGTKKAPQRALLSFRRACERWDDCEWLATAVEERCRAGDAERCRELAGLAFEGRGVGKDEARAVNLARKACEDGDLPACRLVETWTR